MTSISKWYSASRPWPLTPSRRTSNPHVALGQLGLGAEHWPREGVDAETLRRVEATFDWFLIPTLTGDEWFRLCPSESTARDFADSAGRSGTELTVLQYDLQSSGDGLGWDIGSADGGHSVIPHELGRTSTKQLDAKWLNTFGLFRSYGAALEFWESRSETEMEEEPSSWVIARVCQIG